MSNNTSSENHIQNDLGDIALTFSGPTICNISSMICIVGLLNHLKKLHKIIKRHLMILLVHNFICSLIIIGILIFMAVNPSKQNLEICSLFIQVGGPPAYITGENISLLSYIRYHLAWKTAHNEAINQKKLIVLSVMVYTMEHLCGPVGYLVSLYLGFPSGASSCAGLTMENETSFMAIFQLIKVVFALAFGIVYDILMIQFLQKRKNSIGPGQVKLVPWKSSSDTNKENNILVPVSATIASLVGVIVSIGIAISFVINLEDYNSKKGRWKRLALIYNTGIGIGMPVLLGLTIRAAKKNKPAPNIPHEPMFHDDSNSNQVQENENTTSYSNQRPMSYDDPNLDNNENENAIYVISGNADHPFSPQIQESNL